jgi:hypothetical protein
MMLTKAAFRWVPLWYMLPPAWSIRADRYVWGVMMENKIPHAYSGLPTLAYRTLWRAHYDHFGVALPGGAKELVVEDGRYVAKPV